MTTVRILGSRAREQMPGTSITLLAPGFRGSLTQLLPGMVEAAAHDLPFAESSAGADVMLAAQLTLQLEAIPPARAGGLPFPALRSRSAVVTHPRVIVPRRPGVTYALLQTDENGVSCFLAPQPGDDTEAVFRLNIAAPGRTRRSLRVLMWPELQATGPGSLAVASRWERLRRPHQLAQFTREKSWQPPDWPSLAAGPVLLLLHDTFSTSQATFAEWLGDPGFAPLQAAYQGRCLAFTHPTLAAGMDDNLDWLVSHLGAVPGPVDVVAHGRGGLLARALAVDGRLPLRRVCQVGTPNQGTVLARESHLPHFLDAHVAMLADAPQAVAQPVLEGALCLARCVAQGLRAALPGVEVLTPDNAPLRGLADFRAPHLQWFTVGAQFHPPQGHAGEGEAGDLAQMPNDLLVPAQGCHEPGIPVTDSLHLAGSQVHHHSYFRSPIVRGHLGAWLSGEAGTSVL
jgi:hypothetical protein